MSKFSTFIKLIRTPNKLIGPLARNGLLNWLTDKKYAEWMYKSVFGEKLNLKDPVTYNEKLQWLKLYDRRPEYTAMADKYRVREHVASKIGDQYLVPLLGVWENAGEIDFDTLPERFVLKCNHDQGSVVICRQKNDLDIEKTKKNLNKQLKKNHYWPTREWPYKNIKPCIIGEKYMSDDTNKNELSDYKVLCFNGEPKLVEVHRGRFDALHTQDWYDVEWRKTEIQQPGMPMSQEVLEKPIFANEMFALSKVLAKGLPHVRVDWYYTGGHLYFSELTFYDGSGFGAFAEGQDEMIGKWLVLPGMD